MAESSAVLRYRYIFACGGSGHELTFFSSYDVDKGLGAQLEMHKHSNINQLLAELSLSAELDEAVRRLASERSERAIIDNQGRLIG